MPEKKRVMKAAIFSGIGKIECREVPIPEINEREILLRVGAASICGTDLRIFKNGHFKIKEGQEIILGHEFSGTIWEVGSKVKGFKKGMRVGVAPNIGCGKCRYCRMGKTHLCRDYDAFGISINGAFAEYVKIDERAIYQGNIIRINDETSFDEIALAEPLSCCYNGYESVGTKPGETVLIVGAGPIGALHLQLQRLAGARLVMIADLSSERLRIVKRFNPDITIDTSKEDLYENVMNYTDGIGADVIITACPAPEIQRLSLKMAARLGRINFFGGLSKGKDEVLLNTNIIHYNGLIVTGTTGASVSQYEKSIRLIESKKVDTKALITRRFKVEQIKDAFEYAGSGEGLKTVIEF